MNSDIEELVLSGKLFNSPSRSSSPVRSRSPSPSIAAWPTDDAEFEYDSDAERRRAIEQLASQDQQDSVGMGPGRTGVKGVIRDRAEAAALARSKRAREIEELNRAMEKASLGGKTWAEEERERFAEKVRLEGRADERRIRRSRFGHLREVGMSSFVQAVEEDRNVWVLVHIYDPSLDRCASLDDGLSRMARLYPSTKFLRARAGALGFASTSTTGLCMSPHSSHSSARSRSRQQSIPGQHSREDDNDDPFEDVDASDDDDDDDGGGGNVSAQDEWEDDAVDTDVLPTLLVYRGGELEHAWVRVDWEAEDGVEELLRRHHILSDVDIAVRPDRARGTPSLADDENFGYGELVFGGSDDERD